MSLVENLINQISTRELGGITKPLGFDLNNDTFAQLFEKQLNNAPQETQSNFVGHFGMPPGLIIEPIDGVDFAETVQDQMEVIGENKLTRDEYINQPIEFKDIDLGDHFSKLLKFNTESSTDFMNFAKKNATNHYQVFAKNLVLDANEFFTDVLNS